MVKHFTLLLLIIGTVQFTFSKGSIKLIEINPASMADPGGKVSPPEYRFDNTDYLVLHPETNSQNYLQQYDINIQSYLGNGYYLVALPSSTSKNTLLDLRATVGYLSPETKIDEHLNSSTSMAVTILYSSSVTGEMLTAVCNKTGIQIITNDAKNAHFSTYANLSQLRQLAQYPFIVYITKYYEKKNSLMYESTLMMRANETQESLPYGYNLKGEGMKVGVWDDGGVGTNFDLPVNKNFVIDKFYSFPQAIEHTTEVAGCIGGQGNISPRSRGITPQCSMYYWDVTHDIVNEISEGKTNYGIDISNHSYNFGATTCFESGLYIAEAADLDRLVYNNPTMLPVVAVGNSASTCTISDTFSSVDIGFQGCKNVLTVGWIFSDKKIVGNSGRGPTSDGRLKPELVAKGFGLTTDIPDNGLGAVNGSSYASPQIAGLSASLYQKYKQQTGSFPNADVVKALLCNTARDLGKAGPDYTYGFGIPDAYRAVNSMDNIFFYEDNISQGEFRTHSINVPANTYQLKITLSWTDKEGSPIAVQSLVNNLDLKVVTPAGDTVLPWVLNPALYKNAALRGIDNVNNIEQVTIDNPAAGSYTIVAKGTSIPFGPQNFAVAYFSQEKKLELTFPDGGELLNGGETTKIRWYGNGIDSLAKIEFSSDNGGSWQTLVNNVQLSTETFSWVVPNIASDQCLIRITSGNNVEVSAARFKIGILVNFLTLTHTVCDKTIKISWGAVTGATAYNVYLFVDTAWTFVGQTNQLNYTINNLSNGKTYMYTISTIVNGVESNKSLAKIFLVKNGVCTTLNDIGVSAVYKPLGGRKFTSSALTATEKISLIVKNYGTATQNSVSVSYRLNGGPVRTAILTDVVTGNDTSIIKFAINEDLSAAGTYNLVAWTSLAGDNNPQNDTLITTIRHLPNLPLVLPFSESFENAGDQYASPVFGINGLDYADYYPEDGARLRTNEGNLYSLSGNKAIALDNYSGTTKRNELIFTYNLSSYVGSVIFLDFNYLNRSEPDAGDSILIRGSDTQPWVLLYNLFTNRGAPGTYKAVKELNLLQKLKVENGQDFSSSTQIRIAQTGNRMSTSPYGDGGYSFDDMLLYDAGRDVSVVDATINKVNCDKSFTPLPLTIKVKNNSAQAVTNLPVFYQVNNNAPVSEVIPVTINATDTGIYTFTTLFNYSTPGQYIIKTWANNTGDNYRLNDTFSTASVIVMHTIDSFPYYNDFENENGNLFSEGTNNSWVWGTPAKYNISNSAQENKAWTTGINKGYNFNENSYLYMGCMDFTGLTTDPLISFDFISVMQTQSDSAYAEYSTDGITWNRLGCFNCGLNWYNGYPNKPYWDQVVFPWQVAHTTVPLGSLTDSSNFMYRIHLLTDEYIVSEGLGIDDLHILKDYPEMRGSDSTYITQTSSGSGWMQFFRNGKIVAELYDDHKNLGVVSLGFEADLTKPKQFDNQTIYPRNWVVRPQNNEPGNFILRLYTLNTEYTDFIINEDSISRMGDIGMLRYVGLNTNLNVGDNHVKAYYKYYSPQEIQFFPYLQGYYVQVTTDTLGEFYLISTKQDADAIQNINLVDFSAQKVNDDVFLQWSTTREINSQEFVIQYSFDAINFIDVDTVPAGGFSTHTTFYNYLHQLNAVGGVYYYRIKIVDNTNKATYSLIDSVDFSPSVGIIQNATGIKSYIAESDIVVEMSNMLQVPSTVNVYNSLGQLQFSKKIQLVNGVNPLGIADFIHWSNGAYYLQVNTTEHNYYSKLVKQK